MSHTLKETFAYQRGKRAALLAILADCVDGLGYGDVISQKVAWVSEREHAVAALRKACDRHGDNQWSDNAKLADVIQKHLVDHLDELDT